MKLTRVQDAESTKKLDLAAIMIIYSKTIPIGTPRDCFTQWRRKF